MPILHIPRQLRTYCDGRDFIEIEGEFISELLAGLAVQFPDLGSRVVDASGALVPHLVVIQNDVVLRTSDIGSGLYAEITSRSFPMTT